MSADGVKCAGWPLNPSRGPARPAGPRNPPWRPRRYGTGAFGVDDNSRRAGARTNFACTVAGSSIHGRPKERIERNRKLHPDARVVRKVCATRGDFGRPARYSRGARNRWEDRCRCPSREATAGTLLVPMLLYDPASLRSDSLVSWPAHGSGPRPARGQAPAGHPRLCWWQLQKSWVAGPRPAMTHGSLFPRVGIT